MLHKYVAKNWMNYTDNKLCFKTVEIHFMLTPMQRVDYRFCFTPLMFWCFDLVRVLFRDSVNKDVESRRQAADDRQWKYNFKELEVNFTKLKNVNNFRTCHKFPNIFLQIILSLLLLFYYFYLFKCHADFLYALLDSVLTHLIWIKDCVPTKTKHNCQKWSGLVTKQTWRL